MNIKQYLKKQRQLVDSHLDKLLPDPKDYPTLIHGAMRYSLKGGKRIRPILCLVSAQAGGGKPKDAIKTACAIELIHTYSLVHDDLPSMDNDDYRRGNLTCHKKFGTANAVLTGDALLTRAFEILSEATPSASLNLKIIKELSNAAGTSGMIGGQAVDISSKKKDLATLEYINIHKTGALIAASCKTGAIAARAKKRDIDSLFRFGEYIGVIFQMVDDIIDKDGLANIMGPKRAYKYAAEMTEKAKEAISSFGKKAEALSFLADFILKRRY